MTSSNAVLVPRNMGLTWGRSHPSTHGVLRVGLNSTGKKK